MCSLSKEQSILSRETIQNAFFFFSELCLFSDLDFISSVKHLIAEHWHRHAMLLFPFLIKAFKGFFPMGRSNLGLFCIVLLKGGYLDFSHLTELKFDISLKCI